MSEEEPQEVKPGPVMLPDGTSLPALADGEYDVVILGTGLKECIMSGLLSVDGKKILHMDRNDYYGAAGASLNLTDFCKKFGGGAAPPALGNAREYNIDLIPKYIMADGDLIKMLVKADVNKYLEFKQVDGSFVFKGGKVHKVPSTPSEAVASSLVGFFEKKRLRDFVIYVNEYEPADPKTAKGRNLQTMSARELLKDYSFDEGTVDFIGHAMALFSTDEYLGLPAIQLVMRIKLYQDSLMRFMSNGVKSPYIYPLYGLGELPQGFARLSAVYGGTFMLNRPVDRIIYDAEGRACGVVSQGEYAKCKAIVADPSYFAETEPAKVKRTSTVVRAIAILSHPITDSKDESCQIIIPQKQVGRRSDIYVFLAGSSFNICPAGKYLAFVSTTKEKATPQEDLAEGVKLLGKVDHIVFDQYDVLEPNGSGESDGCFISKSYDASSHFEETSADCMDIYRRLTGTPLDLTKSVVSSLGGDQ